MPLADPGFWRVRPRWTGWVWVLTSTLRAGTQMPRPCLLWAPPTLRPASRGVASLPNRLLSRLEPGWLSFRPRVHTALSPPLFQVCREYGEAADRQPAQIPRQRDLPNQGAAGGGRALCHKHQVRAGREEDAGRGTSPVRTASSIWDGRLHRAAGKTGVGLWGPRPWLTRESGLRTDQVA